MVVVCWQPSHVFCWPPSFDADELRACALQDGVQHALGDVLDHCPGLVQHVSRRVNVQDIQTVQIMLLVCCLERLPVGVPHIAPVAFDGLDRGVWARKIRVLSTERFGKVFEIALEHSAVVFSRVGGKAYYMGLAHCQEADAVAASAGKHVVYSERAVGICMQLVADQVIAAERGLEWGDFVHVFFADTEAWVEVEALAEVGVELLAEKFGRIGLDWIRGQRFGRIGLDWF